MAVALVACGCYPHTPQTEGEGTAVTAENKPVIPVLIAEFIEELRKVQKDRGDYHSWSQLDSHVKMVFERRQENERMATD